MIYLKSLLAGLCAVVLSAILYVLALVAWMLSYTFAESSGRVGAVSFGIGPTQWIVGALIFAAGFWWEFRRESRARAESRW
jgi:hypothetical protein